MDYVSIQAQLSGLWRTYNNVQNNSQRILAAMQELKSQFPDYRIRAIDSDGRMVDILP
jgi:hypothetical protein